MSEKNTWAKRIVDRINPHVDEKFEEYRIEVSTDLANGVTKSAGILILLASATLALTFSGLALGLFLGWLFNSLALGMLIVSLVFVIVFAFLFFKGVKILEKKVFAEMSESLRLPDKQEQAAEQ